MYAYLGEVKEVAGFKSGLYLLNGGFSTKTYYLNYKNAKLINFEGFYSLAR